MDSKNEINNKVNEIKGYTESSNESNNHAVVVYKIPTDQLNSFLDYILLGAILLLFMILKCILY